MAFDQNMMAELTLLAKFPRTSMHQGIKIHSNAEQSLRDAAQRLYDKGIIDSPDGGYLTDLGLDLISHLDQVHCALQ
ncbi:MULTISPECIES: TIGR02647 family protein [Pseudoalteromonas]|uniref:TIGR02647 family protein n=2 Tax=Pseudoalteromonas TaxID=53246 RepID=A0A1S1N542_9GAMM|nr:MULTISPECIES: TIGR02647 family protein [Pseudoalteromonas]MCF6434303.1 TIGR02647 family protein [Pseudoalteromonas sp. MMG022]OHU85348.1 TIGR02647 family protein [Pseudoalteromonas sp. JW3]OHU93031.1 TIGR02647 family protein [Pseudoalteromonas amylolytica]OHU94436.1 TIGR02647 family protein [Pseudoalteromonas byunsanensis]